MQDYWSTITDGNKLYQMGAQSHRIYLLNKLCELGVKTWLDVGCGTAPLYDLVERQILWGQLYEGYKGVDPSEAMIHTCQKHFPEGNFLVENATNLSVETDNSFDAVVFLHSFDYIYDYKLALEEAYRVAKKYVILCLWQPLELGSEHRLNNTKNGTEAVDWSTARLQHFAWPKLREEAEEAGLLFVELKDDAEVNKEGKHNTILIFKKL